MAQGGIRQGSGIRDRQYRSAGFVPLLRRSGIRKEPHSQNIAMHAEMCVEISAVRHGVQACALM